MSAGRWVGQPPPVAETQVLRDGEVMATLGEKRKRPESDSAGGGSPERPAASLGTLPLTPVAVHAPQLTNGPDSGAAEDQQGGPPGAATAPGGPHV